jgi:hypothetical protein
MNGHISSMATHLIARLERFSISYTLTFICSHHCLHKFTSNHRSAQLEGLNLEPRNLKIQARHFLGLLGCVPAASMYTLESTASVDLRPRGETGGQEGVEMASSSTRQYSCGSQWEESTWIWGVAVL